MQGLNQRLKIAIISALTALLLTLFCLISYLVLIPTIVSSNIFINFIEKQVEKDLNANLEVVKPVLITSIKPEIALKFDKLLIIKDNVIILDIKNIDTKISFSELFKKRIIIDKLGADYIFADTSKLSTLFAKQNQQEQAKCDFFIDFFNALLYVKKCVIVHDFSKNCKVVFNCNNLEITAERNPKYVHFDIVLDIINNGKKLSLNIKDDNKVYTKNRRIIIDNCPLNVDNSKVLLNLALGQNYRFASASSSKFNVATVVELLRTNFIIANGDEMLSYFKEISGNFDFNVEYTKNGLTGFVNLNKSKVTLIPLADLKLTIDTGYIDIKPTVITLSDIKGYYCNDKKNTVEIKGTIKDHYKSFETDVIIKALAGKEFSKNHLSKIVGYPLEITGVANNIIYYKSKYNNMNIWSAFMLRKGNDILVDGASLSPVNYDRVATAEIDFDNNDINIKKINYYIASTIDRNSKINPILTIWGKLDGKTCALKNLGFIIPKPLPSEFLNVLIGQKVFRKGKIAGNLEFFADKKVPSIKADLSMDKVAIPAQRMFIRSAKFAASGDKITLNAQGKYKRSDYSLTGSMLNEMKLPAVITDVNLTLDNLDIERFINSLNQQNKLDNTKTESVEKLMVADNNNLDENANVDAAPVFDTGLLIVENCVFNLLKANYKDINVSDLKATLTLDKNGLLKISSNKFNIAQGISSCKIVCDLVKHKYDLLLGVKDINSDIMATSMLGLKREISGKASGIIHIQTDDTLALNGIMKFNVKNGTICKIGLIEYVLKFAALFRNPLAMISPSTFYDILNIPEGNFDKIEGDLELKNNVIEKIVIKSMSPQLSSLIVGKFDLISRDATLRIYTKFSNQNKGFGGFLRNFSLNSLANKVPLNSRNDSAYYSAELKFLPPIEADEKDCQVFLTKVDGDVEHNNFISSLKKIK